MASIVTMPKLGLTMSEGTISKWNKNEGDAVAKGDVLFTVATDKLTYEYQAEEAGILIKIIVPAGGNAPVGGPVGAIGVSGEKYSGGATAPAAEAKTETAPAAAAAPTSSVSSSASGKVKATPKARKMAKDNNIDLAAVPASGDPAMVHVKDVKDYLEDHRVRATPLARKIAAEKGIDLASLGVKGRIYAADVKAAVQGPAPAAAPAPATAPAPTAEFGTHLEPMSQMRKIIAERMTLSGTTVPTVNYQTDVDASAMVALREQIKPLMKISFNDIIMFVCTKVLMEMPMCNCTTDMENHRYIMHDYVNMGLAIAVENGLLVPNIKGTDKMSLGELAKASADMIARSRVNKLTPDEMSGGTFTVSSLGMFGIKRFTPIINPPESCILGVTAIEDQAVVRNGQIVVHPMTSLCLTADHRAVDGALAAKFLARCKQLLEAPTLILL